MPDPVLPTIVCPHCAGSIWLLFPAPTERERIQCAACGALFWIHLVAKGHI
jgi:Nudix N-terminal